MNMTREERQGQYLSMHFPPHAAAFMTRLEADWTKGGGESSLAEGDVEAVTGTTPITFDAWVQKNKDAFL